VFGLKGADWVTVVSTGVVLVGAGGILRRLDFSIDSPTYAISLLPSPPIWRRWCAEL
jgi:hypothetical protein